MPRRAFHAGQLDGTQDESPERGIGVQPDRQGGVGERSKFHCGRKRSGS